MLIFIFEIQGAANRCGYDSFIRWQAYKNGRGHTSFTPIALTRLAAKTHGVRVARARELYTKVIRSVLSYGATAWHTPTQVGGTPRGVVRGLQATQTRCLRVVAGAYKATPNRNVESETWVPPLDLYFEQMGRPHGATTRGNRHGEANKQRPRRHRDAADLYMLDPPAHPLHLHEGLNKARSSLLTQIRTGVIGLRQFRFRRRVPDVPSPLCSCGEAPETVAHLALSCDEVLAEGKMLDELRDRHDLLELLNSSSGAAKAVRWMASLGKLGEYRLAWEIEGKVERVDEDEANEPAGSQEGCQAPRERAKKKKRRKVGL